MRRRATTAGVVAVLAFGGAAAGGTTAAATPVCVSASTSGTVTGPRQVGPACVPYPYPVMCQTVSTQQDPYVRATVQACVPAP